MARILLCSSAVRIHDSQAYRIYSNDEIIMNETNGLFRNRLYFQSLELWGSKSTSPRSTYNQQHSHCFGGNYNANKQATSERIWPVLSFQSSGTCISSAPMHGIIYWSDTKWVHTEVRGHNLMVWPVARVELFSRLQLEFRIQVSFSRQQNWY